MILKVVSATALSYEYPLCLNDLVIANVSRVSSISWFLNSFPRWQLYLIRDKTDQGSVYVSKTFSDLLPMYVTRSMSWAGTPTDNSAMQSINDWIKAELFMDFHVTNKRPVQEEVDKYIKFFN